MLLFLLAGLLGLFGHGPLSATANRTPDRQLVVSYDRFVRYQAPESLRISVTPDAVSGGAFHLDVGGEFFKSVELKRIVPEPENAILSGNSVTYRFLAGDTQAPTTVLIHYEPRVRGWLPIVIGLANRPKLQIRQFSYP